ncbi:MAG: HEAT repeat domain-containing protein [Candidatus Thorarchaeota archaeon]
MSSLWDDLLRSVKRYDFVASRKVLDRVLAEDKARDLAQSIQERLQAGQLGDLRYRDHVFRYFGLDEVYFALRMTSNELLDKLSYAQSSAEGRQDAFDLVVAAAKQGDPTVWLNAIDVEQISQSEFAVLLPIVLEKRSEEMKDLHIYCSLRDARPRVMRYLVDELMETYYGMRIVIAAQEGRKPETVVGSSAYSRIRDALETLGLDIQSMLVEVPGHQWQSFVADRERFRYSPKEPSFELVRVEDLFLRIHLAETGSERAVVDLLNHIESTGTTICNKILYDIAESGSRHASTDIRTRALRILGERGDRSVSDRLATLLTGTSDAAVRKAAANALSAIESRIAWVMKPETPPTVRYINREALSHDLARVVKRLMADVRESNHTTIRDALLSLAEVGGPETSRLLQGMMRSPERILRLNVVAASSRLPREDAADIIKLALDDEDEDVRSAALREIDRRWSDDTWIHTSTEDVG